MASLGEGHAEGMPSVIARHYTTAEGLPSNNVSCALKDMDGFLWFGTWYGLCRFDGDKFLTYNRTLRAGSDIPPRKIESMVEDRRGQLWLKTVDWKLYTFNRETECFHSVYNELKQHAENLQVIKIQRTTDGQVLLLTKDKTLLLGDTDEQGAIRLRKLADAKGKIDALTLQLQEDITAQTADYTAYVGRDYRIFAQPRSAKTSLTEAMQREEATREQQHEYLAQLASEAGIAKYSQLYLDRDSLLWVSTGRGVYCISKPQCVFTLIRLPENDLTGVRCLYQTRQGDILVGTRSRNVYRYRADGELMETLPYERYHIGAVYHAMEDSEGRLWLSTKGDGLVVDGRHYRNDPADPASLSGDDVYVTFCDSQQRVWVGTLDGGLNLVREEQGRLRFYNKHNGFSGYPAYGLYNEVRNIVEDTEGRLWIGTIDGLMSIEGRFKSPQDVRFETYRDEPEALFANNDIYTLYRDQRGQIWIGAFGGGLQKLGGGPLGPREGLRNDVIFSIVEDHDDRLWLATEGGLSCYNQQTGRIRNFDRYDGLPDVEIEEAAAICCTDGQLWIGCKEGILTFSPDQLRTDTADYRTVIIGLMVNNQPYRGEKGMAYTERVELPYEQNSLSLEFAALNYRNHAQLSYRYRLMGYDRDWRYSGGLRMATYTEVPPGSYTFVVETIDDANPTLRSRATIGLRIRPPWWATWWAYLMYAAAALMIAWIVARTILQMNRMRNEVYISQRLAKLVSKPDEGDEFIDRLHRIIRKNIANTDFNIDAIAAEMNLSRSAFYKKVKQQTGFAPVDLIKEFRLSHAAELLQTTRLSIAEVAFRSGFADSSYFGKCFRKRYGLSPREYVRQEEEA